MSDEHSTRDFAPRAAIVTASDSGIGRATAIALARAGLDVGVTWHSDEDGARETARLVREHGRRAVVTQLDVADAPACGDVIDGLIGDLGGIQVFVNNAGTGGGTPFLETSWQEWRETLATNLDGAFVVLQRAARSMADAGHACWHAVLMSPSLSARPASFASSLPRLIRCVQ